MTQIRLSKRLYKRVDHARAVAIFLSAASGLDWETCRSIVEANVPGGIAQAIEDADTFFTNELPAVNAWRMTADQTATITQPVLSVVGTRTEPLFAEAAELLHSWLPQVEDLTIATGHLLHMEDPNPVALGLAEFFAHHPMSVSDVSTDARRQDGDHIQAV